MLENIKMLLGIAGDDTSKDNLINYYINSITTKVLKYCKLDKLSPELNQFIEIKVASIIKATSNNPNVKSIARGDTTISYSDSKSVFETAELTTIEKEELDKYKVRKVKFI